MKKNFVEISEEEFLEHQDSFDGICANCQEWSCGGVEGDAENYKCESCGNNSVMGADNALICRIICFV